MRSTLWAVICLVLGAASAHAAIIWQDGWENAAGTTCNNTGTSTDNIMDAGAWTEYGPGSTCTQTPPITTLSTVEHNSGNRSLRVHFKTGDGSNGPDFRLIKSLGTNRNEFYFREYIKWDSNWRWATADHKTAIFGIGNQQSQDWYINVRGQGGDGSVGRLIFVANTADSVFNDTTNGLVVPGRWYLVEAHIVTGVHGSIQAKVNGTLLNLTYETGPGGHNPNDINNGSGLGYFKIDTTYNDFQFFEDNVVGANTVGSNVYYDDMAICDTWCGPVGGATSPPPPPPTAPPPPPPSAPPPPPPTGAGVFFNEGWESGALNQTFNSNFFGNFGNQFSVQTAAVGSGTRALQHTIPVGSIGDNNQYGTQHFGDSPSSPVWPTGAGNHYQDIYLQYKVRYSPGFNFTPGNNKMLVMGTQDTHTTSPCCDPWSANYVTIAAGNTGAFLAEGNNKQSDTNQWIELSPNLNGYSRPGGVLYPIQTGRWYTVEVRRRLNDPGVDNGIFQMWIDGVLQSDYRAIRFRIPWNGTLGVDTALGSNWMQISDYINTAAPQTQSVFYDDVKLSTTYIGVGGTTPPPPPPPPSSFLRCDINRDGATTVTDLQQCVNQAMGIAACLPPAQTGSADINSDNQCNVIDVQRVSNNALGGSCLVTP